jgi:hypothetical protein
LVKYSSLQSPGAAYAILAERASTLIAEITAAARESIRLEQQLQDQGAPADQIDMVRRYRDQIMTAAGDIFTTAMEAEAEIASHPPGTDEPGASGDAMPQ